MKDSPIFMFIVRLLYSKTELPAKHMTIYDILTHYMIYSTRIDTTNYRWSILSLFIVVV